MSYEQVKSVCDAHANALMSQLGVVGCGTGKHENEYVIMIFTLTKDVQVPSTLSHNGITVNTKVTVSGPAVAY